MENKINMTKSEEIERLKKEVDRWLFVPPEKSFLELERKRPVISLDIETYSPTGFPQYFQDSIVVTGIAVSQRFDRDVATKQFIARDFSLEGEKELLGSLKKLLESENKGIILSYNGSNFDIPYLLYRGSLHNIDLSEVLSNFQHVDVYQLVKSSLIASEILKIHGHLRLKDVENYFNLSRVTKGIDGKKFFECFTKNKKRALKYNKEDTVNTLKIAKKLLELTKILEEGNEEEELYDFQENILNKIRENNNGLRPLIQLPTGTGKTRIVLEFIKEKINNGSRFIVVAPTRLLIDNVWRQEIKKWGLNPQQFISVDGRDPIFLRKRWYHYGDEQGLSLITTPITLTNDVNRGFVDLSKFECLHLDEAHHAIARGFDGWRGNYNYSFLNEWDGKLITGTTIKSNDQRIKALKKRLNFKTVTDPKAKTQKVERKIIKIRNENVIKCEKLLRKGIGYYFNTVKKLTGLDFDKNSQSFFYLQDKFKELIKNLPENKIALLKSAWKKTAQLFFLKQLLHEDMSSNLYMWTLAFTVESQDKRYESLMKQVLNHAKKIRETKTDTIIRTIKKLIKEKKRVLIHTRTRSKAKGLKRLLKENSIKSGILKGGLENPQAILERYLQKNYPIVIMTPVGVEGVNLFQFDVLLHISPYRSKFRRTNLRGRIARDPKGKPKEEIYFLYEGTSEESKLKSNEEFPEFMVAEIAIEALKENLKTFIVVKETSENKFEILSLRKDDKNIKQDSNLIEIPIYLTKESDIKRFGTSTIGQIGESIIKWYLSNKGFLLLRPKEALRDKNKFSREKIQYLRKLCTTVDFVGFKDDKKYLIEVKTIVHGKYPSYSRLQKSLLIEGRKLGFRVLKPVLKIDEKILEIKNADI